MHESMKTARKNSNSLAIEDGPEQPIPAENATEKEILDEAMSTVLTKDESTLKQIRRTLHYAKMLNERPWTAPHATFLKKMETFFRQAKAPTNKENFMTLIEVGHASLKIKRHVYCRKVQQMLESLLQISKLLDPMLFKIDGLQKYSDLKLASDIYSPTVKSIYHSRQHATELLMSGQAKFYSQHGIVMQRSLDEAMQISLARCTQLELFRILYDGQLADATMVVMAYHRLSEPQFHIYLESLPSQKWFQSEATDLILETLPMPIKAKIICLTDMCSPADIEVY